jgi:cyclomaltodextrinase / maltogenic alpha-amylase / neopullulanase
MQHWAFASVFYHIYPLGFSGAPLMNDFSSSPVHRLEKIETWLDHIQHLGVNALYLGPVFESTTHGYDSADYFWVDRRLGDNQTLARLSQSLHQRGIRLVLDGVFNHVGRDFCAFRDVCQRLQDSPYLDWFHGITFTGSSPYNDPFTYESWRGNTDLVRLNLSNPAVKEHIFQAVAAWVRDFNIDGLRLDVADDLDPAFMRELASVCRGLREDFWLMGEVIHGDYRGWANPEMLHSVTNYELYKGLYSSHADRNYFEIAYSLNRQFGQNGIYAGLPLYAFADNHDVNRVASSLTNPSHLIPLYTLLFTVPGVPSIYYGSEWGIEGTRSSSSDKDLRPCLDLSAMPVNGPQHDLTKLIAQLAQLRRANSALKYGSYHQLLVDHEQFAFLRQWEGDSALVAVNSGDQPVNIVITLPEGSPAKWSDAIRSEQVLAVQGGKLTLALSPCSGRIWFSVH